MFRRIPLNFILLASISLITSLEITGQTTFTGGALPEIDLIFSLSERVKLRTAVESRESLVANNRETNWDYDHVLTDLSAVTSVKVGLGNAINGGYLVRFRDGEVFHRLIQQYRFFSDFANLRLGHRVGFDQTFGGSSNFIFRTRYRIILESALNGDRIDPQELYLKLGNEYLWILSDGSSDLEIRLVPLLGYEISPGQGIEGGFDFRMVVTEDKPVSALWFSITYFRTFTFKK